VQKQTRAEAHGAFNNTAQGGQPDEGQKDGEKDSESRDKELSKSDTQADREPGELPALKDLTPKFSLTPGPKAPALDENGNPSMTDDHIQNVEKGMQTLLSTREFVYYAYYNRIKDALRQHWEPNVREKVKIIYRQGRTIASSKDRVTQVLVTLNPDGELVKVEVLTQSGVMDLDSAAVEAFRQAAPFPNPPKGMVEADGTIKIRWDFVLEA
jgi:TonB family protein